MFSAPQNTHILTAQKPLNKNSATFLTIFLDTLLYNVFKWNLQKNLQNLGDIKSSADCYVS